MKSESYWPIGSIHARESSLDVAAVDARCEVRERKAFQIDKIKTSTSLEISKSRNRCMVF